LLGLTRMEHDPLRAIKPLPDPWQPVSNQE
jgi:hypothetical protein